MITLLLDRTRRCQATVGAGREKYESAATRSASDEGRIPPRTATFQASTEAKRGNDRTTAERN